MEPADRAYVPQVGSVSDVERRLPCANRLGISGCFDTYEFAFNVLFGSDAGKSEPSQNRYRRYVIVLDPRPALASGVSRVLADTLQRAMALGCISTMTPRCKGCGLDDCEARTPISERPGRSMLRRLLLFAEPARRVLRRFQPR